MQRSCELILDLADVMQVLDAVIIRVDAWENTMMFLQRGSAPNEDIPIEECSDAGEAKSILDHYRAIQTKIESQISITH